MSTASTVVEPTDNAVEKGGPPADKVQQPRTKARVALIMLALSLATFLAALDSTIVATALPTISEYFHSAAGYTWIGSAFLLASAASTPSWAKFSDVFGRKPMLLVANVIFMVGSLVAALSNSIGMLIAARAVQGIGGGGLIVLSSIVIGDIIPLRKRGLFYAILGSTWAIAAAIGPIIGGALTQHVTWRWCFYINLPTDGLAFVILLVFLDVKTPKTPLLQGLAAIDWIGSITVTGGTVMFLLGLQYGGETGAWGSAKVICLIVFGIVTFAIFLLWEWKKAKYPMIPLDVFAHRTTAAVLAIAFIHGVVFISATYYLPLYFQVVRGASPTLSGVYILPLALSLGFSSIATGAFNGKVGLYLPPIYFGFIMLTLGFGLFIDLDATSSWAKIIIYQIIAGLGIGPLFQGPIVALQANINPRDIGPATAAISFSRSLATGVSIVIGQVLYESRFAHSRSSLSSVLTPAETSIIFDGSVSAETFYIARLPEVQRTAVRAAFAGALRPMWIMYAAIAATGLIAMVFVRGKVLTSEHSETVTGLESERVNAEARKREREAGRK